MDWFHALVSLFKEWALIEKVKNKLQTLWWLALLCCRSFPNLSSYQLWQRHTMQEVMLWKTSTIKHVQQHGIIVIRRKKERKKTERQYAHKELHWNEQLRRPVHHTCIHPTARSPSDNSSSHNYYSWWGEPSQISATTLARRNGEYGCSVWVLLSTKHGKWVQQTEGIPRKGRETR